MREPTTGPKGPISGDVASPNLTSVTRSRLSPVIVIKAPTWALVGENEVIVDGGWAVIQQL